MAKESEEAQIAQAKAQVEQAWSDERVVAGWQRWHEPFMAASEGLNRLLVDAARLAPGERVLELAAGTGSVVPRLSLAVGAAGRVTATDLAPGMVAAGAANAANAGLSNVAWQRADAHALPFPAASFDAAVSRFGVMFFGDPPQAFGEIRRVLAPGGRVAFVVWGPRAENPLFTATVGMMARRGHLPPPVPGTPGPFTYEIAGLLPAVLRARGYRRVEETTHRLAFAWPGPPETVWALARDILPSIGPCFEQLPAEEQGAVTAAVVAALRPYATAAGTVDLPVAIHLITGENEGEQQG